MGLYVKALVITVFVGLGFVGFFWVWKENTLVEAPQRIVQIDQMETDGLPAFSLKSLGGQVVQLADFKGQVVIVSFWASWCGPCLEEFPSMIELVEKMNGQVKLLAISQDSSRDEIEAFLKSFPRSQNPNIFILWDEDHKVGQQFNAERLPESFVAGRDHKLARKIVGSINWATPQAFSFMKELVDRELR